MPTLMRVSAASSSLRRVPPVAVGVAPALAARILMVARSNALLERALVARGCKVERAWTLGEARRRMHRELFDVVLVEPDLGAEDGVAFAVSAKSAQGRLQFPLVWIRVPFVVLPERGDVQAVIVWGDDRVDAIEGDAHALAEVVVDLWAPRT